mmetsp:Transcript_17009/g.31879  ORF Transcript_17009/g.31879 Transcript_17009/m.31879 type:complete len:326 (+) Transcript_17009:52-1029(+)
MAGSVVVCSPEGEVLAGDKPRIETPASERVQVVASEPAQQAQLQPVASESRERKVTLIYGTISTVFGWKLELPARAFGDELRNAVRFMTGLQTLEGVELHALETGNMDSPETVPRRVSPRDIFEGRVQAVRIIAPARTAASSPSSKAPAAATRGGYAPGPAPAAAAPPRTRNRYAGGPAAPAAAESAKLLAAPAMAPLPVKSEGKFQKKGGSQLEFVRMMSLNKNPVPKLPEGIRLTAEEVAKHRKPGDAWTIFQGRVYDITSYLDFHPGGKGTIMKGAGKDCTELYNQNHPWVNCDGLIGKLCLGKLELPLVDAVKEEDEDNES